MAIEEGFDTELTGDTLELLQYLVEEEGGSLCTISSIPRRPAKTSTPLSFAQQRLWFLSQLEPEMSAYHITAAIKVIGALDVPILSRVFSEIVRRHEILRTSFTMQDEQPVQIVAPAAPVHIPVIHVPDHTDPEREQVVRNLLTEYAQEPFDLEHGPLFRVRLLYRQAEEYVLNLTVHHIAADGWSMGVLVHEMAVLYEAFSKGGQSPLPELSIQYADFAAWQHDTEYQRLCNKQLEYWCNQLTGASVLEIPTDHSRPATVTSRGAHLSFVLPKDLVAALQQLSVAQDTTLFMTLAAAFNVQLARYCGQDDICLGTPIANRGYAELEPLVGFFVNTLALRTSLQGDPTFLELLGRVRQVALDAYAHQDVPFEQVVSALGVARSKSRIPLVPIVLALQNTAVTELRLPGVQLTPVPVESGVAAFDVTLLLSETADGLHGTIEYSTDLFRQATMVRLGEHFRRLLESIVANPAQRLSMLSMLSEEERHQILVEWNDTNVEFPYAQCIHEMFEVQVNETTDAIALEIEGRQLSYGYLHVRANQLAHRLRTLGIGPEQLVGLCLEPSLEMIIGILGCIKAGGAYVPLDPHSPAERLAWLLDNAGVTVLLTLSWVRPRLPDTAATVLCLDDPQLVAHEPGTTPDSRVHLDNLVYVIYTSGSTGRPKGVQISHRGLANSNLARDAHYRKTSHFLLLSSIAFDSSVVGVFWTLCNGGTLHLLPAEVRNDPRIISHKIFDDQISHLLCLPSLYDMILTEAGPKVLASVQEAIVAGEVCPPELVTKHRQVVVHASLFNEGGATEASVFSTVARLTPISHKAELAQRSGSPVSYGGAIANTQLYVLDRHLQLVPEGIPGEFYIGGTGVARGYLARPLWTAERFLPDPYGRTFGARMYRTGDMVRWRADGELEILGRIDHQVKIRGFRIELEEIEAVLGQHPAVSQAAVVVVGDRLENKRLVAYVAARNGDLVPAALRDHLRQALPEYMVPHALIELHTLPLNPNGKVDRPALQALGFHEDEAAATEIVEPRNPVEERLVEIWKAVLGRERVGVTDDFFELGGHSLLAMQVASRMRTAFLIDLPLPCLFTATTISALAEEVFQRQLAAMDEKSLSDLLDEIEQTN